MYKNSLEYISMSSSFDTYLFNLKVFFFNWDNIQVQLLLSFWLYEVTYDMFVFICEMRGLLVSSRFFYEYINYYECGSKYV